MLRRLSFHTGFCRRSIFIFSSILFEDILLRIDDHNMAKLDALFHGKKEHNIVALPNMSFLSNFGFEDAADIEDLKHADTEAAGPGNFDTASSLSSDTRSRAFSVLSDYDLGTNAYSDIHEGLMAKSAPILTSASFASCDGLNNTNNIMRRMDPMMSRYENFAVQTATAAAYASNSHTAPNIGANLPKMHSNAHYRDIKTAFSKTPFRIGDSSSSPRLPAIRSTAEILQSQDNNLVEGMKFIIIIYFLNLSLLLVDSQFKQPRHDVSMADSLPINILPASTSVAYSDYDHKQQQSSECIDDFMNALDPLALSGFNNTNRNISFQFKSNVVNNEGSDDSDDGRDLTDDACEPYLLYQLETSHQHCFDNSR